MLGSTSVWLFGAGTSLNSTQLEKTATAEEPIAIPSIANTSNKEGTSTMFWYV